MQSSIYDMELTNELLFNPVGFFNYNLDPTRRTGSETSATFRASDTLLFRDGFAYTRAVFREGPFTGNDVPAGLAHYTASGGVTPEPFGKNTSWSTRRCATGAAAAWANDQPNSTSRTYSRRAAAGAKARRRIRPVLLVAER